MQAALNRHHSQVHSHFKSTSLSFVVKNTDNKGQTVLLTLLIIIIITVLTLLLLLLLLLLLYYYNIIIIKLSLSSHQPCTVNSTS